MIYIEQRESRKVAGETSLFIKFNYKKEIIERIKLCDGYFFDKKESLWEVPLINLPLLLDNLCELDDIECTFLEEEKKDFVRYELQQYKTEPFDYQLDGIQFGLNFDKFLLLDAPGLGKTLQICYLAQELKSRYNIQHCLIICGINTLKINWKKEIEKHTNLSCKILGSRINRKGKLIFGSVNDRLKDIKSDLEEFFIITNIETIRNNDIVKEINNGRNKFDLIVCDEIHTVKNNTSSQGKNFLKLTKSKYRIGATGTLLLNNPFDCYVPLRWIEKEHCSISTFKYFYGKYGGPFGNELIGYKNIDFLKREIEECSIRRTKDLLDLPPKKVINEFVDLNPDQEIFYNNIKKGIIDQVDKVKMSTTSLLAMIARLRQATACPSILTTENIRSSKIDRCVDLINQIINNKEKVVVFSTFKETLNVLNHELSTLHPLICTGDMKDEEISNSIDLFQNNEDYRVMLATWSKMGTGITLTAASNVIFIDCAWTQAQNLQAEDRCYRIGSKKSVFIYYLWASNTIDMRVKELVEDKSMIFDYVIDNNIPDVLLTKLKNIILDLSVD